MMRTFYAIAETALKTMARVPFLWVAGRLIAAAQWCHLRAGGVL